MSDQEREVKFYIQDLEAMAERLQAGGADLVRQRTFELNLRFDTAFHELHKADASCACVRMTVPG